MWRKRRRRREGEQAMDLVGSSLASGGFVTHSSHTVLLAPLHRDDDNDVSPIVKLLVFILKVFSLGWFE